MTYKKKIIVLFVAVVFLVVGLLCFVFPGWLKKDVVQIEKVTVGVESSLLSTVVWIADYEGYFEEENLDVVIKEFDSGRLSFLDMLDGGVDFSTVAPTPIMFSSFERDDFSIFATFAYSDSDLKVVAHGDKGISTVNDLKGKKVGTSEGTTGQFFLSAFLKFNGMTLSDVEMVDIAPFDLAAALNDGVVDAIVIWEPHAYNAQVLLGDKSVVLPNLGVYRETFNFMIMNDFAEENPEILERFLGAINRATEFIENDKERAQNIVTSRLELDREVTAILWEDFVFDLSLNQWLVLTLEDEARWAVDSGFVPEMEIPNYLDYIYVHALEVVVPKAMTIIK